MKSQFMKRFAAVACCALSVGLLSVAKAADKKDTKAAKPAPAIPKKMTKAELNTPLKTISDYADMLKKAGYTVKTGKTAKGKDAMIIQWKEGNWGFLINLTITQMNGENYLQLLSPLANIPDLRKIPVVSVVQLLKMQDSTQGWFFVLSTQVKRFYIGRLLSDKGVTLKLLLAELKSYENNVKNTQPFWNPAAWKQASASNNKAPKANSSDKKGPKIK